MTKIIKAKYKISRRLGVDLWGRDKDPINRKNYRPGQHGVNGRQAPPSDYKTQLFAKQQLKGFYGRIREKQFRSIFKKADNMKGDTGQNLIGLLETRLDAVVYRLNFAVTVFGSRQLVSHGHILVNGKKVDVASYTVKPGDVIELKEKSRANAIFAHAFQNPERDFPEYFEVEQNSFKGTLLRVPSLEEVPYATEMHPNLVVEFYSRN